MRLSTFPNLPIWVIESSFLSLIFVSRWIWNQWETEESIIGRHGAGFSFLITHWLILCRPRLFFFFFFLGQGLSWHSVGWSFEVKWKEKRKERKVGERERKVERKIISFGFLCGQKYFTRILSYIPTSRMWRRFRNEWKSERRTFIFFPQSKAEVI